MLLRSQSPSLRGSGRFRRPRRGARIRRRVSIPFIAGQWSLPVVNRWFHILFTSSQSPSLRGSGRFLLLWSLVRSGAFVSIPFIAGQWSLR